LSRNRRVSDPDFNERSAEYCLRAPSKKQKINLSKIHLVVIIGYEKKDLAIDVPLQN